MRQILAAAAALSALAASALPAAAETVWVGNIFIKTASAACAPSVSVGDSANLIYRPAGTALGNGADSYLTYVSTRSMVAMLVPNNTFQKNVNYSGTYVSSRVSLGTPNGAVTAWTASPATFATNTTHATLTATLTNFFAISGCTVQIVADLEQAK